MNRQMWALTIDFWRSRGWQLAGTLLLPMLLPMVIYGPLFSVFRYDWQHDPANVMIHVVLTEMIAFCSVGTLLTWLNSAGREYTLPITTWKLVVTRSVGGALATAATYTLAWLMVNWLFQARWPLLGPMLLLIAVYQAAQAVRLLTMKSQVLGLFVFAPLCLFTGWWFFLRYETGGLLGRAYQQPKMWTLVTWSEWITLLLVGVGGVWGSYYAARLQRMGSGPTLAGLIALGFGESSRFVRTALPNFTTCQSALRWREWRERGRAIPCLFATAALIYGCLWWMLPLNTQEAVQMGGGMSMMGAMSFWLWGIYLGQRSSMQGFSSFDATRPITDAQCSESLLRNMTRSTLAACGMWVLGVGLVGAIAWGVEGASLAIALGNSLGGEFAHAKLTDSYDLAVLIGGLAALSCFWVFACWTFSANGMMLALLRRWATIVVVPGSMAFIVLVMLVTTLWVPLHLHEIVVKSLWGTFSTLLIVATLVSFVVAWRQKLIGRSTCLLSLVAWLTLASGIHCWIVSQLPPAEEKLFAYFVLGSLLLLPFLPLAATPLAVAWNRHR